MNVKDRQQKHWDSVAAGWAAWFEWTERNFAPVTNWLRDAAVWRAGSRVLDVACGAGYPAFAAARAVGPAGHVVATDLSPHMIDVASKRARAGVENIEFVQRDAEDLQFRSHAFDAVMHVYGLMFCPDPPRALAESHRVLVPDGRIAVVTWDLPARSPFFKVFREVAADFFELRDPGPGEPHPFRLSSADVVRSMLEDAGFSSIHVERVTMTIECESVSEYCQIFKDYGWNARIDALPPDQNVRFHEAMTEATRPYADGGRLQLAATSLCASARR